MNMSLDVYNPSIPRIFIAEANRTNSEGIVKPSYLVAMVNMAMLLEWWQCVVALPSGHAGFDDMTLIGQWGGIGLDRQRYVEHHLHADGQTKFESLKSSVNTVWFDLVDLGDVFVAPAKTHVIVGSKAFISCKGKEVAARLKLESAEYARIERALKVREPDNGIMLLGPFMTNCSSSFSF
jgi:hypothetical protein